MIVAKWCGQMSPSNVWGERMRFFKKKTVDTFLNSSLETERFRLIICDKKRAFQLSLFWKDDPEILLNMMIPVKKYTQVRWYKDFTMPDHYKVFYHAIVDKQTNKAIGLHKSSFDRNGTVGISIVVHDKNWWGKDVYFETRAKIIEHFSKSERVIRFYGRCLDRNFSSIYNYKKLGFRIIGYDHKAVLDSRSGQHNGTCHFELLTGEKTESGG